MRREEGHEVDRRASNWTGDSTVLGEMARIVLFLLLCDGIYALLSRRSLSPPLQNAIWGVMRGLPRDNSAEYRYTRPGN